MNDYQYGPYLRAYWKFSRQPIRGLWSHSFIKLGKYDSPLFPLSLLTFFSICMYKYKPLLICLTYFQYIGNMKFLILLGVLTALCLNIGKVIGSWNVKHFKTCTVVGKNWPCLFDLFSFSSGRKCYILSRGWVAAVIYCGLFHWLNAWI